MSYPEVYILGRQVDGVYVEYLRRTFYTLSDAKHNADFYNKHYNGEWKILKYGRPITVLGDDDQLRTSTFNYIKDILGDYYKTDDYIRQREEELRYPYRESDLNSGIKGSHGNNEAAANLLITIEQDRRLASLERNKRIIDKVLSESCEDTITIIQELHFKKRPRFTMQGLIDQGKIFCSRRKAFELQRIFFEEIAKELNLDI